MSDRLRALLVLALAVLVMLGVSTVAHLANVARIALRSSVGEAELLTRQLFHQSARVIDGSRPPAWEALRQDPGMRALLEGMVGYSPTVVDAAITDAGGRAILHSNGALEGTHLPSRENLGAALQRGTLSMVVSMLTGPEIYEVSLPVEIGAHPFGTMRVGVSTSLLRRELTGVLAQSLALAAGALAVATAVALGVGQVLLRSVRRLAQGVERLVRRDTGHAVDLTRDDELGQLAAEVDRLGWRVHPDGTRSNESAPMDGLLSSLEAAIVLLNRRREVVFCNQAASDLLEWPLGRILGRPVAELLPPAHPLLRVVAESFDRGGERHDAPLRVPSRDGRTREVAASSYRIADGVQTSGAVLAVKDLDPVRAVQSLVTYSQKLAALGRLTSGVAHEVKNPLNAMRIHVELLGTRLAGERPEIRENLDVLAQSIQRLDRVVQGFLRFVRPQDVRPALVDVNAILAEVRRLAEPEAADARCRIVLDLEPDVPGVMADAELLRQAYMNLVANAIQAMPHGGVVTLATRGRAATHVEVHVRDEGVGIPPEALDKIFRLYYTTKPHGSGIGLSLVYRIVQMHDGRIDVESDVDKGTTVILTLPVSRTEAARP